MRPVPVLKEELSQRLFIYSIIIRNDSLCSVISEFPSRTMKNMKPLQASSLTKHLHRCMHIYMPYTCTHACTHISTYVYKTHTYTHTYMCIYVYVCVCVCYIYVYKQTHRSFSTLRKNLSSVTGWFSFTLKTVRVIIIAMANVFSCTSSFKLQNHLWLLRKWFCFKNSLPFLWYCWIFFIGTFLSLSQSLYICHLLKQQFLMREAWRFCPQGTFDNVWRQFQLS